MPAARKAQRVASNAPRQLLEEARAQWFCGEFDVTLELAQKAATGAPELAREAGFLRARVFLRRYDNEAAVQELIGMPKLDDVDERATHDMLCGLALHRLARPEGWHLLRSAASTACQVGVRTEAALCLAQAHWAERELSEAESLLERTLDPTTGIIYARGLELLGWIEDARERYGIASRYFLEALRALDDADHEDAYMRAGLLQILSSYAVGTLDLRLGRDIERETKALPSASGLQTRRWYLVHNLGTLAMLEGDFEAAWGRFADNLAEAGQDDRRAIAHTNLALVTRANNDAFASARHFGAALALLHRARWANSNPDDRNAPLDFAIAAAGVDRVGARQAWDIWTAMQPKPNYAMALQHDRRVKALQLEADGASGPAGSRSATASLRAAEDLWRALGLRHYEARAALARYRNTGDPAAATVADLALRAAPSAWLRRDLEPATPIVSKADELTHAERRIMLAICDGKSASAIAQTFGRSVHTVRNQTRKVFQTMGVRSRAQLVAECARLGLLRTGG